MILIAFLFIFAIYLAVFYFVARLFNRFCQRRGKNTLGKLIGGSIMFGAVAIIFWDAIPTRYTHDHLCHTEFGLKVNMTPEEWAKKYPERFSKIQPVPEHLLSETKSKPLIETRIDHLNSEIDSVTVREMEYGFGVVVNLLIVKPGKFCLSLLILPEVYQEALLQRGLIHWPTTNSGLQQ